MSDMSILESTTWGTVSVQVFLQCELSVKIILLALLWSHQSLIKQERLFHLCEAQCHFFPTDSIINLKNTKFLNIVGSPNQIQCFKTFYFMYYSRLLVCWISPPSPHSPFDTCYTFPVFGPPLSASKKNHTAVGIVWRRWRDTLAICMHNRYLIFRCAGRQTFYFGFQLDKHVGYGGDPRVKVFVFIVLGTEVPLVPLTLLQSHDCTVCATGKHGRKMIEDIKEKTRHCF